MIQHFCQRPAVSMFIAVRTLPNYQKEKKKKERKSLTGRIFLQKIKIKEI